VRPLIEHTYDLDDIHAALDRLASGQQFGKLAVRIRG
jgi:NADPH:quinone reductase-like Zn-dependent oxidoreductase